MSFFDDWFPFSDEWEDDDSEPYWETHPRRIKCDRCGGGVRWRQQGGKWVLFSLQPGVVHQCPDRVASPDEFPDA